MPVVFQQPEPVRGDISTGFGAAEQWSRDYSTLQRSQQGVAEATLQSAALQQRAQQASMAVQAENAQRMYAQDQRGQEQAQAFALAQQQMGHQSDMLSQQAQLQDQLASNQLTRSEQMRMERMRNAVADIQANPDLDPEMKRAAVMQIQTGINEYQMRQSRAQQAHSELQNTAMQRQIAQFDQMERQRQEFNTQGLDARTRSQVGPDGRIRNVIMGRNGDVDERATALIYGWQYGGGEHSSSGRGGGSGGGSGGATDAAGGGRGAYGRAWEGLNHQERQHIVDRIEDQMRHESTRPAGPAGDSWAAPTWATSGPAGRENEFLRRRNAAMGNHAAPAGQQPTEAQRAQQLQADEDQARDSAHREFNLRNRERIHNATSGAEREAIHRDRTAHGQLAVVQRQLQRQQGTTPSAPAPLRQHANDGELEAASSQRFTADEMGGMNGAQRTIAEQLNGLRSDIGRSGATAERQGVLTGMLNEAQAIVTRYGDTRAMSVAEGRHYAHLLSVLSRMPRPRTQPQGGQWWHETLEGAAADIGRVISNPGSMFENEYSPTPRSQ